MYNSSGSKGIFLVFVNNPDEKDRKSFLFMQILLRCTITITKTANHLYSFVAKCAVLSVHKTGS